MRDLIVLVADKDAKAAIGGLLGRQQSLEIRPLTFEVVVHPRRDPGCRNEAHNFLRSLCNEFKHALVVFDYEGCGKDRPAETIAGEVRALLARNGWDDRAEVVILVPELEVWVWSDSPHVEECLGWAGRQPTLREWLQKCDRWPQGAPKPPRPKECMEAALAQVHMPRSSTIYRELAEKVSLRGHNEPAFTHFTQTLQRWFRR